jgi:NAD(P)-dependent dehydrogenase (short-subunit alcohol dehydrogenase family)
MKILISGHSRGIGHAIAEYFGQRNYEITGFSRSNNKDLSSQLERDQFVIASLTNDIIVLNANLGFNSIGLLYQICQICKGQTNKTIVIIGSQSTETTKTWPHPYQIEKLALESAAKQMQNIPGYPTIIIVRPGYVDTDSVAQVTHSAKMSPNSVAELIYSIIEINKSKDYKILNILFVPK